MYRHHLSTYCTGNKMCSNALPQEVLDDIMYSKIILQTVSTIIESSVIVRPIICVCTL